MAEALGRPVEFVDPVTGGWSRSGGGRPPAPVRTAEPPGPTPWATGLAAAAFFAVFVAVADVVLSRAFAEAFGLLWVPANLLVGSGLAVAVVAAEGAVLAVAGAGCGRGPRLGMDRAAAGDAGLSLSVSRTA